MRLHLYIPMVITALLCGTAHAVVGGDEISDQDWPFTVSLRTIYRDQIMDHTCGGAYIGNGLIMTAAHCLNLVPAESSVACIGASGSARDNNCYPLAESIGHPNFESATYTSDLAIYRLQEEPYRYPHVSVITEALDSAIQPGDMLQLLGLGSTSYESYVPSTQLLGAQIAIISQDACQQHMASAPTEFDTSLFICGGQRTLGPAPGDSGSPVLVETAQGLQYAGLVSQGYDYVGFFTRLGLYREWIETTIAELTTGFAIDFASLTYWTLTADSAVEQRQFVLTNRSESQQTFVDLNISDDSVFTILEHDCNNLAPTQSCTITLDILLDPASTARTSLQIALDSGDSEFATLIATRTEHLTQLNSLSATLDDLQGGGDASWIITDENRLSVSGSDTQHQVIYSNLTGPGTFLFSSQLETVSGSGSLQARLDDELVYQLSGDCSAQDLTIEVPEGPHRLTLGYFASTTDPQGETVELYNLAFVDTPQPAGELSCSYRRAGRSSGGGGSSGVVLLLALLVAAGIRGRFQSPKASVQAHYHLAASRLARVIISTQMRWRNRYC